MERRPTQKTKSGGVPLGFLVWLLLASISSTYRTTTKSCMPAHRVRRVSVYRGGEVPVARTRLQPPSPGSNIRGKRTWCTNAERRRAAGVPMGGGGHLLLNLVFSDGTPFLCLYQESHLPTLRGALCVTALFLLRGGGFLFYKLDTLRLFFRTKP